MRIINDLEQLQAKYGFHAIKQLLFTAIRLDSRHMVTPMIAETPQGPKLLARQQELGNLRSSGVNIDDIVLYEPWVTIDPRVVKGIHVHPKLVDAVAALAQGEDIVLGNAVAWTHHQALSQQLTVSVEPLDQPAVRSYRLDATEVLAWFRAQREVGVRVADAILARVNHLQGLRSELGAEVDTRFTALDALAEDLDVGGFLMASPPNFSEVTGLPAREDVVAVRAKGSHEIVVIAPVSVTDLPGVPISRHDSLAEAVVDLLKGGSLAVEEQWISAALALQLQDRGLTLVNSSNHLGGWRDVRDHEDLAFQLIAARASVECIEDSLEWARAQLSAGGTVTERAIADRYLELVQDFRAEYEVPFAIEEYFTNLTASNRMLFPGPPTDFQLNDATTNVQLDAGVKVSVNGVVLATSDMARSLMLTVDGKEGYDILTDIVRDDIIGAIRPGVVMEDVHEGALEAMVRVREQLEAVGFMDPEVDFVSQYRKRNVGHLMGKQESFCNELRPGYTHVLHVGSFGAAEVPWRYGDFAIGTEDMWYVGPEQTFNVTLR